MSTIANRRELMAATQALVKTNAPDAEHYNRLLAALGAVATDDMGQPVRAVIAITKADFERTRDNSVNGEVE